MKLYHKKNKAGGPTETETGQTLNLNDNRSYTYAKDRLVLGSVKDLYQDEEKSSGNLIINLVNFSIIRACKSFSII